MIPLRKLFSGSVMVFVLGFVGYFTSYLTRLLLTQFLPKEDYGLIFALLSFFGLLIPFQSLGLYDVLTQKIPYYREKQKWSHLLSILGISYGVVLTATFLVSAIIILFSGYITENFFPFLKAQHIIILYSLTLLVISIQQLYYYIFQGFQHMKTVGLYLFCRPFLLFILLTSFLLFGYGIYSYPFAYLLSNALLFVIFYLLYRIKIAKHFKSATFEIKKSYITELASFASASIITASAGVILTSTDTAILSLFRSLEEVADYNVVLPTVIMLGFLSTMISTIYIPLISKLWAKKKTKEIETITNILFRYLILILLPCCAILMIYPEFVLYTLFGNLYVTAGSILRIIAFAGILINLNALSISLLKAIEKPQESSKTYSFFAALNLILNLLMIPVIGGYGAAISSVFCFFGIFVMNYFRIRKYLALSLPLISWGKQLFCCIIFGVLFYTVFEIIPQRNLFFFVGILGFSLVFYLLLLVLVGELNKKDLRKLFNLVTKKERFR